MQKSIWDYKSQITTNDEWIMQTMNIETFDYNMGYWIGKAISKCMERHQNAKCFNCGRIGHLRWDYK